jgi:hypothetical protein
MLGLNSFHGLQVTKSDVRPPQKVDNYNATVDVPNASILTIEIVRLQPAPAYARSRILASPESKN